MKSIILSGQHTRFTWWRHPDDEIFPRIRSWWLSIRPPNVKIKSKSKTKSLYFGYKIMGIYVYFFCSWELFILVIFFYKYLFILYLLMVWMPASVIYTFLKFRRYLHTSTEIKRDPHRITLLPVYLSVRKGFFSLERLDEKYKGMRMTLLMFIWKSRKRKTSRGLPHSG